MNSQLQAANEKLGKKPTPVPNWIEERNRKWESPLANGPSENRRAVITAPPVVYPVPGYPSSTTSPTVTSYYSDSYGRYWIDSSGVKHYTR